MYFKEYVESYIVESNVEIDGKLYKSRKDWTMNLILSSQKAIQIQKLKISLNTLELLMIN